MLVLLNTVVVKLPDVARLPPGLEPLIGATPAGVLKAGAELYAKHPRLEYDRPDIAEWYCSLLAAKVPGVGGVLFEKIGERYVGRLAEAPFPLLARLYKMQRDGFSIVEEANQTVWYPAKRVLAAAGAR